MKDYQREFIEFAVDCGALRFGRFTLKSGRRSPYFFNTGVFDSGARLARLGAFYARALVESNIEYDMLYGPAYKGIPLVTSVAIALWCKHERNVPYAFNRKEPKDHGEGGTTVGAALAGRVVVVDDVISAGTSLRESVAIIETAGAEPVALAISLDRQERGTGANSALQEAARELGVAPISVTSLDDLEHFLAERDSPYLAAVEAYRKRYGAPSEGA